MAVGWCLFDSFWSRIRQTPLTWTNCCSL